MELFSHHEEHLFTTTKSLFSFRYHAFFLCIALCLYAIPAMAAASTLGEEAYHQIEANVFNGNALAEAVNKMGKAHQLNNKDPWVYLSASLFTLVQGYKIGDWYRIGTFQDGTVDKALGYAAKALEVDDKESQCYAHLARLKIIQKKYREAWDLLDKAHELEPDNFYAWYFRGIIAEKMRDPERGISYFQEAEKHLQFSYQQKLLNNHRQELAKLSGDAVSQEALLKKNIDNYPNDPIVYGNYAMFLKTQKRYDESITYWEKAIALSPYRHALEQLEETRKLRDQELTLK